MPRAGGILIVEPVGHQISRVDTDSIAQELGLKPGDELLLIDGKPVIDVFDYRLRQLSRQLLLTVRQNGSVVEYDLEKDEDEDLGLEFTKPLLDEANCCANHCLFCFIDQLPAGLRPSLYFKDDDLRLSFLSGNYTTLTNISDDELARLIAYRFSPMNISVHATDGPLRRKLLRHPLADCILPRLRRIAAAGLAINCQLVLCPQLNDGEALRRTLDDLIGLGEAVLSIALVPVGITRYRQVNHLYPLRLFEMSEARAVLAEVMRRQDEQLARRGMRLVYAADEFYLAAGQPLPPPEHYDDFPQLENGVGMAALFLDQLSQALNKPMRQPVGPVWSAWPEAADRSRAARRLILVTGTAAAPLFLPLLGRLSERVGCPVDVVAVVNRFLGETVTVAGLLTGQDLADQLQAVLAPSDDVWLIVPTCLCQADQPVLLDDWTLQDLSDRLAVPLLACRPDGASLCDLMDDLSLQKAGYHE
jgi:putative radical SAM enzyme (TIGR03279 family)